MKPNIFFFVVLMIAITSNAQKVVSGKSELSGDFKLKASYELGDPPNLYAELNFSDYNGNGIIEADENAVIEITLTNKGIGLAQGLQVKVIDSIADPNLAIGDGQEITFIHPDESINLSIPIKAGLDIESNEHKLKIEVLEHFGYDMEPTYLRVNTLEYQPPKIVYAGYKIDDSSEGTNSILRDQKLQPGEMVKLVVYIQNVGQGMARNIRYNVSTQNSNVYLRESSGQISQMTIGEVKELVVFVSPNKRIASDEGLKLQMDVSVDHETGGFTAQDLAVGLNQQTPETEILEVKADIEKIKKQMAHFEYTSEKFTANVGKIEDIREIAASKSRRKDAVAVVIGIEDYQALSPAPYAENDAVIIKEYFQKILGIEKVVTYNSKEATGLFFDDVFNPDYGELQKAIVKNETELFVFYSGHGLPSKDGQKIYLFPSDGKTERLTIQGYDINKFYINLEKLEAKTVTVFIDACFSGASRHSSKIEQENLVGMKGVKIKPKIHQPWRTNQNFSVFTSSLGDQTSLAFDPTQTGLFTYYLCVGLQGKADSNGDKTITNKELSDYIKENVVESSRKISGLQIPEFFGNGNYILVSY